MELKEKLVGFLFAAMIRLSLNRCIDASSLHKILLAPKTPKNGGKERCLYSSRIAFEVRIMILSLNHAEQFYKVMW